MRGKFFLHTVSCVVTKYVCPLLSVDFFPQGYIKQLRQSHLTILTAVSMSTILTKLLSLDNIKSKLHLSHCFHMKISMCVSCLVISDTLQPHRLQPTRPLRPWDSPGKHTGVGFDFLLPEELCCCCCC